MRRLESGLAARRRALVADLGGKVLEVGLGTGATIPHYAPDVALTGIDLSPAMLERARARAARHGIDADLREMDAEALDFPAATFDAIVFTLCLCTIPDPGRAIGQALRVARPGAQVRMLEHVRSNLPPVGLLQDLVNPFTVLLQRDHFNRRTADLARAAGLADLTEERFWLGAFTVIRGRVPGA